MRATDGRVLPSRAVRGPNSGRARHSERAQGLEALVELAAGVKVLDRRGWPSAPPNVDGRENLRRKGGSSQELADSLDLAFASATPLAPARAASRATAAASVAPVRPDAARTAPTRQVPPTEPDKSPRPGWRHSYRLGLLLILVVQSALALRLLWSNTAFEDEAEYLWYGHMEWAHWLHGAPLANYNLSGAPVVYPPLAALADSAGGLAGARLLSLCFMVAATALLYGTASRLFGRRAALIAAALFVAVGPTADMSAWATYDPMAIFLLALSSWLAVRAARSRVADLWLCLAAVVMIAADATKWASGLWNPVIVALVVLSAPNGWTSALARGARFVSYAVAIAFPALYVFGGNAYISQISYSTTQRGSGGNASLHVLWTATPMVAAVVALAFLGMVLSWRERAAKRKTLLCAALLVAAMLAPAYQAHIQTTVSLYKHIVFGLWFGAIAGGYALSRARVVNAAKGWRVGIAAAVFIALMGFDQASGWYGYWPNSGPMIAALEAHLPVSGPILMEDGDQMVANYYLFHRRGQSAPLIWSSYLYSPDAISIMIEDHAVSIVETDTGTGIPPSSIQESIAGTPRGLQRAGYRRVAHIHWRDPDGAVGWFSIWHLVRKS